MKNHKILYVFAGVVFGVLSGVVAYQAGLGYACPKAQCVDSADILPITDRQYYSNAYRIISGAEKSIHIATFELKYYRQFPSSLQNKLVRQIIYARERGVEVKILVDEFSRENNAYELLKENGVDIRYDGNETTTHAKLIIVDGRIVLLGSTNLSYYGLEKNHEANVLIEDEETAQYFERYFKGLWED